MHKNNLIIYSLALLLTWKVVPNLTEPCPGQDINQISTRNCTVQNLLGLDPGPDKEWKVNTAKVIPSQDQELAIPLQMPKIV